jgi:hypothetical protein
MGETYFCPKCGSETHLYGQYFCDCWDIVTEEETVEETVNPK